MLRALMDCPVHAIMEIGERRPDDAPPPIARRAGHREPENRRERSGVGFHPVTADAQGRMPLPQITLDNEYFWTSGADGKLRIQECGDCRSLIHPPAADLPLLPQPQHGCAGGVRPGRPRRVHRQPPVRLPGLPAPYVVAQVAIAEDPRVRLTTNIIDCDFDELELGQTVEVVFEQAQDVWLPLFRPTADDRPSRRCRPTRSPRRTSPNTSGR